MYNPWRVIKGQHPFRMFLLWVMDHPMVCKSPEANVLRHAPRIKVKWLMKLEPSFALESLPLLGPINQLTRLNLSLEGNS